MDLVDGRDDAQGQVVQLTAETGSPGRGRAAGPERGSGFEEPPQFAAGRRHWNRRIPQLELKRPGAGHGKILGSSAAANQLEPADEYVHGSLPPLEDPNVEIPAQLVDRDVPPIEEVGRLAMGPPDLPVEVAEFVDQGVHFAADAGFASPVRIENPLRIRSMPRSSTQRPT